MYAIKSGGKVVGYSDTVVYVRLEQTVEHPPASQHRIPTEIETADEHQHEKEVPAITPGKPEANSEPETAH